VFISFLTKFCSVNVVSGEENLSSILEKTNVFSKKKKLVRYLKAMESDNTFSVIISLKGFVQLQF